MRGFTVFLLVLFVSVPLALADAPRVGVVTGTVLAPDGAPMAGATVQLVSDRGTESAVSDGEGRFKFPFVIPDNYTVRADLTGFQAAVGQIAVTAGGRADVELRLAEVAGEEVVVTGETPLVNKFDVTSGGATDAVELQMIVAPNATRDHMDLADFFPTVTEMASNNNLSIGGHHEVDGHALGRFIYFVDGVDTTHAYYGGWSEVRLPTLAVGQVQMLAHRVDAEYSRNQGGVMNTSLKSGTNEFRGEVMASSVNLAWNDEYDNFPSFNPSDKIYTGLEAAVGGPIKRDSVWFFASVGNIKSVGAWMFPGGEVMEYDTSFEPWVAKLDFRPNPQHSLSLTGHEGPRNYLYCYSGYGDRYACNGAEAGGKFYTLRWGWAIDDNLFLDASVAAQQTFDIRSWLVRHDLDPNAPPFSPLGTEYVYVDLANSLRYNAPALNPGVGTWEYPRTQVNASLNWFAGNHDIKFGVDYQDAAWRNDSAAIPWVQGIGFNRDLPGGFAVPMWINYYEGPGPGGVENDSTTWGLFVRDRITVGNHWTFNVGLRLDDETLNSDVGEEAFTATKIAPRLSAVYDVHGDSKLLLIGGAGRYYDWIPLNMAAAFNVAPWGRLVYDQYLWNPATQDFDIFNRHVSTAPNVAKNTIEPAYTDQYSVALEWAFHPDWAFKVDGLYWKELDHYSTLPQILDNGTVATVFENNPFSYVERKAVTFEVQRRFKNNWFLNAAYTLSDTSGNCFSVSNNSCFLDMGALRDAVDPMTGTPYSLINRDGKMLNHIPHIFKVRGNYLFDVGKGHSINLGGNARYTSGRRWNTATFNLSAVPGQIIYVFTEEMGARSLDNFFAVDLNASWQFPIAGGLEGSLRLEIANATNEQVQRDVAVPAIITGITELGLTTQEVQNPRSYRAMASIRF
jgi:hypothetical protein